MAFFTAWSFTHCDTVEMSSSVPTAMQPCVRSTSAESFPSQRLPLCGPWMPMFPPVYPFDACSSFGYPVGMKSRNLSDGLGRPSSYSPSGVFCLRCLVFYAALTDSYAEFGDRVTLLAHPHRVAGGINNKSGILSLARVLRRCQNRQGAQHEQKRNDNENDVFNILQSINPKYRNDF